MVRAGEAGGVLDVIAERIVEGLADGSFPLPGAAAQEDDVVRFWRALGRLCSSGVPVIQVLDLIAAEVAGPQLREGVELLRQAILDGQVLSTALEAMPELFPEEVRVAVALGEQKGELDQQALRIAEALETDDLASLIPDSAVRQALTQDEEQRSATLKTLNLIIVQALKDNASDIHFEPLEDGLKVRYRVDGVLYEMEPPPAELAASLVSRVKIMADLDIAENRLPQEGRIKLNIAHKLCDLRVSTVPTVFGERVVMRIFNPDAVCVDLERIGFAPDELSRVRELCHLPNGIVVSNGPAGSGKTTLLYAMLNEINKPTHCVLSVEDPVEYHLAGIGQAQVDARRGLTYARLLRSVLRQDPDAIMVGEIRDLETIQVCIQCSLTGHLLMTTMHANTSPGALRRLLDVGVEPFLINSSIAGVISQRLVRCLCPTCRQEAAPPLHSVPPQAVEFISSHPDATWLAPKGCDECGGTGYRGRTAIHEILIPDDRVRQAVAASADLAALRNAALAAGMTPMLVSGLEKAAAGITSVQEVCRVAPYGTGD